MKAYKLVRKRKDGTLGPLFINAKQRLAIGEWMPAEHHHRRKGFAYPEAPHLSEKGRVWVEVRITDWEEYARPANQGGKWFLAQNMKVVKVLDT